MKRVVVQDANILIDLEMADLFEAWFKFEIDAHTTDFVVRELKRGHHLVALSHLNSGRIQTHNFSSETMTRLVTLKTEIGSSVSVPDCSALLLSIELDVPLLTGDNALRKQANRRSIEVHGTLWIMDMIVEHGIIPSRNMATRLNELLNQGRFLPRSECQSRIIKWNP